MITSNAKRSYQTTDIIYSDEITGWKKVPLKYLGLYQNGYAFKPSDWGDSGLPIIRIAQLTSKKEPNYFDGEIDSRNKVKNGDLLFSWSATLDTFIWDKGDSWLNQHIFKVTPAKGVDKRFLYYLIKFIAPKLSDIDAHGSAMQHIKKEHLGIPVFIPSYDLQQKIVRYLDVELNKVDKLINKQERLLRYIEEKHHAVVTHTVTRGVNPKVDLMNSGVAWIGLVPSHWSLKKIKYLFTIKKRIVGFEGPDVLSITQSGIKKKDVKSGDGQLAQDYSKYQTVEHGDFAMNHMDLITGYVDISPYDGVTSPDYRVFTIINNNFVKRYFLYIFQECYKSKIFFPLGQGSAQLGRWRLPAEAFNNFILPVPPADEQNAIVKYLDDQEAKVNKLRSSIQNQIALLKERRISLISNAVTGKIKV